MRVQYVEQVNGWKEVVSCCRSSHWISLHIRPLIVRGDTPLTGYRYSLISCYRFGRFLLLYIGGIADEFVMVDLLSCSHALIKALREVCPTHGVIKAKERFYDIRCHSKMIVGNKMYSSTGEEVGCED